MCGTGNQKTNSWLCTSTAPAAGEVSYLISVDFMGIHLASKCPSQMEMVLGSTSEQEGAALSQS